MFSGSKLSSLREEQLAEWHVLFDAFPKDHYSQDFLCGVEIGAASTLYAVARDIWSKTTGAPFKFW